jgi:hypothetical protein
VKTDLSVKFQIADNTRRRLLEGPDGTQVTLSNEDRIAASNRPGQAGGRQSAEASIQAPGPGSDAVADSHSYVNLKQLRLLPSQTD